MDQERNQVLEMLRAGRLTAQEAQTLLAALEASAERERSQVSETVRATPPSETMRVASPDFDRFRRFWRVPFVVTVLSTLGLGLLLISMTRSADGRLTLALLCTWPFFLSSVALACVLLWSRWATWMHVRIQQRNGRRMAISLPVPLRLANGLVSLLRPLTPAGVRPQLEPVLEVLTELRQLVPGEPLFLDVDDEDGERVQIYVG